MMDDPFHRLIATMAVVFPVGYYVTAVTRSSEAIVRHGLVVAIWIAFLSIQLTNTKSAVLHSQETMMFSVMVFIIPLKLHQLILYPSKEQEEERKKKEEDGDETSVRTTTSTVLLLVRYVRGFDAFVASIFYYALPISWAKEHPSTLAQLLWKNLEPILVILLKIVVVPVIDAMSRELSKQQQEEEQSDNYWTLLALFIVGVVAGSWAMDLQCVAVNLLSVGRLEMMYFNNYPFVSRSLQELWGQRYNLWISKLLKDTVFVPSLKNDIMPKWAASLFSFGVSGILHAWVAYFTFGHDTVARAFAFFVIQVPWIMLEIRYSKQLKKLPSVLRIMLTSSCFFVTSSLYAGLFVEAYPDWLDKNNPNTPKLPILYGISQHVAELLGLDPQDLR